MESKGSGERPPDQLQGSSLQDQAVQSDPTEEGMTTSIVHGHESKSEKVVIQFGDELIKGYLESQTWNTIEELLRNAPDSPPKIFRVRRLGSDVVEEIPTENAKAVFYVNNFDGDFEHKPLQFHTRAPIVHGIWVRLEFFDGEVMEGIVHNSIR